MKNNKMLAALLSLVLLAGCAEPAVGNRPSARAADYPDRMDLYCYDAFREGLSVDYAQMGEWLTYMKTVYPMEITLVNDTYPCTYSNNFGSITTGLACLPGKHILPLIKSGKLLPLDEYLKDNKLWNSLPEDFRNKFELDGHIWAIPWSEQSTLKVASIRTDWLEAVGMEIPTSVDELMQVGKAFAKSDPNGNGIADDYLLGGLPTTGFCQQIINSFGFYIDSEQLSVAYDPVEGCIMDSMFKPQAKQVLQLLRDMVTGGMIDPLSFTDPAATEAKNINGEYGICNASVTGGRYTAGINWAKTHGDEKSGRALDLKNPADYQYATSIYQALPLFSEKYPVTYLSSPCGYALAAGTKQPRETVNAFMDMVFGSCKSFLELYLGDPSHYTLSNTVVTMKYRDEKTKTAYAIPRIADLPKMMIGKDYSIVYPDSLDLASIQHRNSTRLAEREAYESQYLKQYGKGRLAEISAFYEIGGQAYELGGGRTIYEKFITSMNALNNPDISVDRIIAEYQGIASYYVEEMLSECNANMSLPNKQLLH